MKIAHWTAALVAGTLLASASHTPALAASQITNVFLTNLEPNVDFLDRSSRFALTRSQVARIRDFAHGEAAEQTLAANDLDDWINADKPSVVAEATPDQANTDQVLTGRSVAIDGQAPQSGQPAPVAADIRLAMGQEDLDRLDGLQGHEFDELYKAKQLDALTQVQADYKMYIAKGDDPILLGIANRELPKVDRQLEMLRKL